MLSSTTTSITPFLWFDDDAEAAVELYVSVFPDGKVGAAQRYPEGSPMPAGTLMTVEFELAGQPFIALNGGPEFPFTEAVSFSVSVQTQDEVDHVWDRLTADGGEPGQCGWLKDPYGLSWQVVPAALPRLLGDPDPAVRGRVVQAMLQMTRLDVATLEAAARS
jgi:predicted 3-demethylubiquinone-9 3-methyltransferase (glyoxalase superfamily)